VRCRHPLQDRAGTQYVLLKLPEQQPKSTQGSFAAHESTSRNHRTGALGPPETLRTLHVKIEDYALRLDPRAWAGFWAAFVHVVRNAVDHGIESPTERAELGKPAEGTLVFTTRQDARELVIELKDDGRGIDWERIAGRAKELRLPGETQADLVEALFTDGLSTRYDVSEFSGRGVGMGAVRQATIERGGTIDVDSVRGHGTHVTFRFPPQRLSRAPSLQRAS
jgi:two-component system chemotaxis sensor kinase CheA